MTLKQPHIIISGGGTGGHIFPAISIADAIKKQMPDCKILFVGAKGRMEMERVPAAGYEIVGLPVAGFQRRLTWKNITFFYKLAASMYQARKIVRQFKPQVVVGVGGYASGPVLRAASSAGIPTLIQEQNSFPGVTNRILAKKASAICVAYPGMERFFSADKIIFTGNPIRKQLLESVDTDAAYDHFGLKKGVKTILVVGGSLGAGSINKGVMKRIEELREQPLQLIWQTGKFYFEEIDAQMSGKNLPNVKAMAFVQRMDYAYSIADLVISRAGAGTISELALLGKPSLLVPSPNVSEDHQTKNAMALVEKDGAFLVKDSETESNLLPTAIELLNNPSKLAELSGNIKLFAKPDAGEVIAGEVLKLIK
ncbi:undecaprenyldiphospho-muramoylpentapeptide beta-N-acetylglucosaminyltransferase [Natronoflexus pectinivorans]|uniref:UDP-N-acetylglucosamine--N-acetylmuramyl-(pentapeptide) pyrophosphoryl-undecaprenol N-acetylglucosamine transferase n=1 Tax=Natronoflexus pectinivorans TaxID=682526 RepID=A0A4R2GAU7_9BACT|nr:undecaprenyldiphospho-muramoylpentapeptide beta-N-acetylglucosaminyltransferase [Natronoflexus pectinivorans]TCO04953.1 UDP-N-acetylglucosamine-N-acetylmuramylpentapeptide N-acetylglucosamine transferase [Natronoflexus pectinivorans]